MRGTFLWNRYRLARFGIACLSSRTMMDGKAPEAADFGAPALGQGFTNRRQDQRHGNLRIFHDQLRKAVGDTGNKLGFGHGECDRLGRWGIDFWIACEYCIYTQYLMQAVVPPFPHSLLPEDFIMIQRLQQFIQLIDQIRSQEAAQRNFLRAIYQGPSRIPADYERPAYLRRAPVVVCQ